MFIWFTFSRVTSWALPYRLRSVEAHQGAIEETWTGRAMAVRDEDVIHAPASGRITLLVNEGQRVRAGDVLCEVNSAGETGALPVDLEKIDQQQKVAEGQVRAARQEGARKRSELTEQLETLRSKVSELQAAGHLEEARKVEGDQRNVEARLSLVAAAEAEAVLQADLRRQELIHQRETVLSGTRSDVYLVRASTAGVVSFQFDGLEGLVPLDSPLHDIAAEKRDTQPKKLADKTHVTAGSPLVRLVNNYHFYLFVSVKGARSIKQGELVQVTIDSREMRMRATRTEDRNGKTLALLQGDTFYNNFLSIRSTDVLLSTGRREGVLVPVSSVVTDKNGNSGVFAMVDRVPVYRPVTVGASDQNHAIVNGIPIEAKVVANPKLMRSKLQ
jgi:putative membrane fusion protein